MIAPPCFEWRPEKQTEIINVARSIFAARYQPRIAIGKGCLFWAAAFNEACALQGLDAILQAGTAQFQFRSDDGKRETHFSYVFETDPAFEKFKAGLLPEMHVWSYLRSTKEIVDLSLRFQPQQAREMCGYEWEQEFLPPPYLWTRPDQLTNHRLMYEANLTACVYAVAYLKMYRAEEGQN